jgi:nicotinate-nucleotide pyrophosphorylase (carboxylating)
MKNKLDIDREDLKLLVARALAEDGAARDVTCEYLGIGAGIVNAAIIARAGGIIAGLDVARVAFEHVETMIDAEITAPTIEFDALVNDGDSVSDGDVIVALHGPALGILAAERVALNFLQRLSGVATLTSVFAKAVDGTGVKILDTRKTTPFLRRLEKYAVKIGGGDNHRYSLSDMLLVKENHFRAIGGSHALVDLLKAKKPPLAIEVEVDSLAFLKELLGTPVDRIMLDNFSPDQVTEAIQVITDFQSTHADFKPEIEVSGGMNLDTIRQFALPGVDFISIGALTHSAPALDLSLEVGLDAR